MPRLLNRQPHSMIEHFFGLDANLYAKAGRRLKQYHVALFGCLLLGASLCGFIAHHTLSHLPKDYVLYPVARIVLPLFIGLLLLNLWRFIFAIQHPNVRYPKAGDTLFSPSWPIWLVMIVIAIIFGSQWVLFVFDASLNEIIATIQVGLQDSLVTEELAERLGVLEHELKTLATGGIGARLQLAHLVASKEAKFLTFLGTLPVLIPFGLMRMRNIFTINAHQIAELALSRHVVTEHALETALYCRRLLLAVNPQHIEQVSEYQDAPFNTIPKPSFAQKRRV